MKTTAAFTLIELLIVLSIVSAITAISVFGAINIKRSVEFKFSVDQVLSDVKFAQQTASTTMQKCIIKFSANGNEYSIFKDGTLIKRSAVNKDLGFSGKEYFCFTASGAADIGGSGTLIIQGLSRTKKIIVSSRGRVRIE